MKDISEYFRILNLTAEYFQWRICQDIEVNKNTKWILRRFKILPPLPVAQCAQSGQSGRPPRRLPQRQAAARRQPVPA